MRTGYGAWRLRGDQGTTRVLWAQALVPPRGLEKKRLRHFRGICVSSWMQKDDRQARLRRRPAFAGEAMGLACDHPP